jgi:LytS/YehU family sensor histidine kinase
MLQLVTSLLLVLQFVSGSGNKMHIYKAVSSVVHLHNDDAVPETVLGNEQEEVKKVALFTLIPIVVAFVFIVFVFYRQKREAAFKEKESDFNRQIAEVEMRALRSQMNPHFLFNCLNSIHHFITSNRSEEAGDYLIKFSKLVRMVLENSTYREVALGDDLLALDLYIQLERMRMMKKFEYIIKVENNIDQKSICVPPLILQPFVENSIWHGLNGLKEDGILSIVVSVKDNMLQFIIEDNGIKSKLQPSAINLSKKKSLGIGLTSERLNLLNRIKKSNAYFTETDKKDEKGIYSGKKIELYLPVDQ